MGQYWQPVNLDRREYIDPHRLASGLKLWEQLANHPGTAAALIILCADQTEHRGGGDLDLTENWHGPERSMEDHPASPGPMPDDYPEIAQRTIGRWAGDAIALVGDYAEPGEVGWDDRVEAPVYSLCTDEPFERYRGPMEGVMVPEGDLFTDISDDVCAVIAHELNGEYSDTPGWRDFKRTGS